MKKLSLIALIFLFIFSAGNIYSQKTIWFSPLPLCMANNNILIENKGTPCVFISNTSISGGTDMTFCLGLDIPTDQKIDSLIVFYQAGSSTSFYPSYIKAIGLFGMSGIYADQVICDNDTDLTSTIPARYSISAGGQRVNGVLTLEFICYLGVASSVSIGAIGLVVSPVVSTVDKTQSINPANYKLEQNYPNPFNPSTTIKYDLTKAGNIKINIYNVNGELIKELLNEEKNSGSYSQLWNGKDSHGRTVASGTYFYRIQVGDFVQAKKMILLK
jgi:hypothetical protein